MNNSHDQDKLKAWVDRLEANPDYASHPLMEEFRKLAQRHGRLERQLTKMARISDRYQAESRRLAEELDRVSRTDSLTGLANRHHLTDVISREVNRSRRSGLALSLLLLDIDRFKRINDTFGHDVGDQVLIAIAVALQEALRDYDIVGRWGGEEFVVVLPHTDEAGAVSAAEHLRAAIADLAVSCAGGPVRPTVSLGVARLGANESIERCLKRADEALYEAKNGGRNQWVLADAARDCEDPVPEPPAAPSVSCS